MCTAEQYEEIRSQLKEWGYEEGDNISDWSQYPILQTRYLSAKCRSVGNYYNLSEYQYICPNIETFLHDCRAVAIREGWFKETTTEESDYIIKDLGVDGLGRTIGFYKIKTGVSRTNSEEPAGKSDVIDWEQRRYEIARECMASFGPGDPEGLAKLSRRAQTGTIITHKDH